MNSRRSKRQRGKQKTWKIRYVHVQIVVIIIETASVGWNAKLLRKKPTTWMRWIFRDLCAKILSIETFSY